VKIRKADFFLHSALADYHSAQADYHSAEGRLSFTLSVTDSQQIGVNMQFDG